MHRISGRPDNPAFFGIRYPAGYQIGQPDIRYGRIPDIRLMYSLFNDFLIFSSNKARKNLQFTGSYYVMLCFMFAEDYTGNC
jgi:hypothetical protein